MVNCDKMFLIYANRICLSVYVCKLMHEYNLRYFRLTFTLFSPDVGNITNSSRNNSKQQLEIKNNIKESFTNSCLENSNTQ